MSNYGSESAETVVRMMLSGTEVMVRLTASATKNVLAMSMALAQNHKKISGKTKMKKMLKQTRDIRVFPMTKAQFRQFEKHAKKYRLLYASIKDTDGKGKLIDVVLPNTEVDRANLVFQKIRYGQEKEVQKSQLTMAEQASDEKNVSRSRHSSRSTRSGLDSKTTSERESRASVEVRLETFRTQLKAQRASARQKSRVDMGKKRMAHKRNQRFEK